MSESAEALFGDRGPHFRGPLFERQLEVPTLKMLSGTRSQTTGTHVSRLPHQEPSVTFVSRRTEESKERNILGSAGHGLLRIAALPIGATLFTLGMLVDSGLAVGFAAGGHLTVPIAALATVATATWIAGAKLWEFGIGKK
ncbi:hypothetical protein EPO14_01445 [Patescibacteria group bacterium]|nr:MAG: hypothetical protein EPO14_01445 [Patescibacteria group bacterium]